MRRKKSHKPKSKVVTIVRTERHIEVHFEYDQKIIDIMHRFRGWFRPGPPRYWQFKPHMENEIIQALKEKKYFVRVFSSTGKDEGILGFCKICGAYSWLKKDKCEKCR